MDVVELLVELVGIESTNATLEPGGPGEAAMAARLVELLEGLGLDVTTHEVAPARPNVLGRLPGNPDWPALVFEAHLDTVPTPPGGIPIRRDGDRLQGRGSCDCKGALAAMLGALERIAATDPGDRPTIVVAGVVDEESSMTGSAALLGPLTGLGVPLGGAVVAEPTSLVPVRAHHGVVRAAVDRTRTGGPRRDRTPRRERGHRDGPHDHGARRAGGAPARGDRPTRSPAPRC